MEDSKLVCTPMVTRCNLNANDESATVHQPTYKSMIGSLLYLTSTRPDIMHAVGTVGIFQANPKEAHLQAIKRIYKYLQGTQNYGLWYPRDTDLTLHAYTDANWVGTVYDRESTSGGEFFVGSILVPWFSKKQISIALSTAEAKYVATASCCTQLLWMMQTLQDTQITCTPPISILCDNRNAISISKNPVMHSKTKHIPIKYHFLWEQVLEQKVKFEYVPSKEQRKVGVHEFQEAYLRTYIGFYGYSRVYLGLKNISGTNLGRKESDVGLKIWHRFRGSIYF
eukprot:PITA_21166